MPFYSVQANGFKILYSQSSFSQTFHLMALYLTHVEKKDLFLKGEDDGI